MGTRKPKRAMEAITGSTAGSLRRGFSGFRCTDSRGTHWTCSFSCAEAGGGRRLRYSSWRCRHHDLLGQRQAGPWAQVWVS